jgi:hypothetical protein
MTITFLAPRSASRICGVCDHTLRLAKAMREFTSPITGIVAEQWTNQCTSVFDRVSIWDRKTESLQELLCAHATELLWIQYSGYGFGFQGIPWRLVRAIQTLHKRPKVVVYFHETHCSVQQLGWKGYAIAPLQRRLGKLLANSADFVLTSMEAYEQTIRDTYGVPPNRIAVLPLGSNIHVPIFSARERDSWRKQFGWDHNDRVAITFGSVGSQRRALLRNADSLLDALKVGLISRIVCVGGEPGTSAKSVLQEVDRRIAQVCTVMGYESSKTIAMRLAAADVAFVGYPFNRLGKSGTFMAYSLAGLPVLVEDSTSTDIHTYRGANLIRGGDAYQLGSAIRNVDARLTRQRLAATQFSWPALALSALNEISIMYPTPKRMPIPMPATSNAAACSNVGLGE